MNKHKGLLVLNESVFAKAALVYFRWSSGTTEAGKEMYVYILFVDKSASSQCGQQQQQQQ